jgi:Pyruvate/2-oxoacid:ferredoxin oxidoreductase delta subunit
MSLVHAVTAEHSRLRRWSLYIFARYLEMPLLALGYHFLRGRFRRLGANHLVRAAMSGCVVAPFGYAGDTARAVPTPQVLDLIDDLEGAIAVGPCRCRAAHRACDHPLETDIVIRTGVEAWTRAFPHEYRPISKDEAKTIVSDCSRQGLWQMVFVHCPVEAHRPAHGSGHARAGEHAYNRGHARDTEHAHYGEPSHAHEHSHANEYVICNCCTCGCVPYILNRDLGQRVYPLLRGAYVAHTDLDRCTGHDGCIAACPFDARAMEDGKARLVDTCFGCGLCVAACPEAAITMVQAEV